VEIGLHRITTRQETQGQRDRFERERSSFFDKVRQTYLGRARQYPQQYRIIDASQSLDAVQQQLQQVLSAYINQNTFT
jgi:dTMP kinase